MLTDAPRPGTVFDWRGNQRPNDPKIHLKDAQKRLRTHEDRCLKCCKFLLERGDRRCPDGQAILRQIELIEKAISIQ